MNVNATIIFLIKLILIIGVIIGIIIGIVAATTSLNGIEIVVSVI